MNLPRNAFLAAALQYTHATVIGDAAIVISVLSPPLVCDAAVNST